MDEEKSFFSLSTTPYVHAELLSRLIFDRSHCRLCTTCSLAKWYGKWTGFVSANKAVQRKASIGEQRKRGMESENVFPYIYWTLVKCARSGFHLKSHCGCSTLNCLFFFKPLPSLTQHLLALIKTLLFSNNLNWLSSYTLFKTWIYIASRMLRWCFDRQRASTLKSESS